MMVTISDPGNDKLHGLVGHTLSDQSVVGYAGVNRDTIEVSVVIRGHNKPTTIRLGRDAALPVKRPGTPTGNACGQCGSGNQVRTGTCVTCQDCGSNEGCG